MKSITASLTGLLICCLAFSPDVLAQPYGMFGPRTLGTSLQPAPSQFGGGLQLSPYGALLGTGPVKGGGTMFAAPWRHSGDLPVTLVPSPYSPSGFAVVPFDQTPTGVSGAVPLMPAAPETVIPEIAPAVPTAVEMAAQAELAAQAQAAAGNLPAANLPAGASGATGAAAPPATPTAPSATSTAPSAAPAGGATGFVPLQKPDFQFVTATVATSAPANGYLPRLSQRLTQIAHDRGIRMPEGIKAYVVNGTTVLRGVVGSPHDQTLVANLAALEPGVWRISNQLTVAPEAAATFEGSRGFAPGSAAR